MPSKQSGVVEGILLILAVLAVLVWFGIVSWRPVTNLVVETVPVVDVTTLTNDSLDQLAALEEAGHSFGIPVAKPAADQVGKSPLF